MILTELALVKDEDAYSGSMQSFFIEELMQVCHDPIYG